MIVSSPSPSHVFLCFMCVCPGHPLLFKPEFTMTIAACWDPLLSVAPTTAGYWWGPIQCLNLPQTIKSLAEPTRAPCKRTASHLLCLLGERSGEIGQDGRAVGFMYLVLSEVREEGA